MLVKVSPEKSEQLSPSQAAGQFQIEHRQDVAVRSRLEISTDLLRLDDLHFLLYYLRRIAVIGGIFPDQFLLDRLFQRAVKHHMDTPDGLRTQSGVFAVWMCLSIGAKFLV